MKKVLQIVLFLLPVMMFSQNLPDCAVAAKMKVKKLVILRCDEGFEPDTFKIFVFDSLWKNYKGLPLASRTIYEQPQQPLAFVPSDSDAKKSYDKSGHLIYWYYEKNPFDCEEKVLGERFAYDTSGLIINSTRSFCQKRDLTFNYFYDRSGRMILWTCSPQPKTEMTREEYTYYPSGQLHFATSWRAFEPLKNIRGEYDYINTRLEYFYDVNGLISQVKIDDPLHHLYTKEVWKNGQLIRQGPSSTVYRYVYYY